MQYCDKMNTDACIKMKKKKASMEKGANELLHKAYTTRRMIYTMISGMYKMVCCSFRIAVTQQKRKLTSNIRHLKTETETDI